MLIEGKIKQSQKIYEMDTKLTDKCMYYETKQKKEN